MLIEHVRSGLVSRSIHTFCTMSVSVMSEEKKLSIAALSPDVARAAHRAEDAVVGHQPLELFAGVLPIAVE